MIEQLELFPQEKPVIWVHEQPPVKYYPEFLPAVVADQLYEHCKQLDWQHNKIRMLGKWIDLPRLEMMQGDSDYRYVYSGSVELIAKPWTPMLHNIRFNVEGTGFRYQLVIGNYYRSGSDHIGWHSDNEKSMGVAPAIASISLGGTRRFQLKPKDKTIKQESVTYDLAHGSLILMLPGCQENWVHRLCKTTKPVEERINLTFRPYVETAK
jgi:alkylated DNA repair dioxygenase AlkB